MRDVVEAVGLMPSDLVMVDDRPLHGRDTVLSLAPLKGRERTIAKVKDDYEGNHLCVLDLVRCSIIVETEMQVAKVLEKMLSMDIVVRLKNRIRPPLFTGMRHLLLNVGIGGHICEVQIHQAHIFDEKHVMHTYFDYFRAMFQGSSASYEQLMVQVEAVGNLGMKRGQGMGSIAWAISRLLKKGDLKRLRGLANLVGQRIGFGDEALELVLRKKIVELEGEGGV